MIKTMYAKTIVLEVDALPSIPIDVPVDITIKERKGKRSRDANAYFHVLVDELRQKLNISFTACKNMLITSYGQIEYLGDVPAVIKTNIPADYIREQETPHMKLIKVDDEDVYWYRVYRGSHTYNTKEMSILIDGTVQECQLQGIDTATPDEIAKMVQVWGQKYEKRSDKEL